LAAEAIQFTLNLGVETDRNCGSLHVLPCNTSEVIAQA
jgi:hypothetical protein